MTTGMPLTAKHRPVHETDFSRVSHVVHTYKPIRSPLGGLSHGARHDITILSSVRTATYDHFYLCRPNVSPAARICHIPETVNLANNA